MSTDVASDHPTTGRQPLSYTPRHTPSGRLTGMVAIVTGAGSGVGAETARVFHAEGAHVVLNGLTVAPIETIASELGDRVSLAPGDVTDVAYLRRLVDSTASVADGRIDVLVNNAGATIRGTIDETVPENFDSAIEVNLKSAVQLIRLVVPSMRAARRGSIINMASITSLQGLSGAVAYTASKAGLTGVTRAIAVELAPFDIRVNAVCPGVIDTPMTHVHADSMPDPTGHYMELKGRQPMNRLASARDCALTALFLASDDSSFITGAAIPVDGGRHAT